MLADLREHPFAPAFAVRGARFAGDHAVAVEDGHGELGAADVDGQCLHASQPASAASTSAGDAVPVPFFMIVTEATRLPKRAAAIGEPVTASARAAPAEKLSPAPQMSTGCSTARAGTDCLFAAFDDQPRLPRRG